MEFRLIISEKHLILILTSIALVSCIGLVLAYGTGDPDDMGHTWGEVYCPECITSGNLADGAVTNSKISSVNWGKLNNVPAGLGDGDNDTLVSCTWTGWANARSSCLSCEYVGCKTLISVIRLYCSNGRITQADTTSCCIECAEFYY